jgi:hypothetical protein
MDSVAQDDMDLGVVITQVGAAKPHGGAQGDISFAFPSEAASEAALLSGIAAGRRSAGSGWVRLDRRLWMK